MNPFDNNNLLTNLEDYLKAGIHIGTVNCTPDMKQFVYRRRSDGLNVISIDKTDERIRLVAKLLTRYKPSEIIIVSSKIFDKNPVVQFAEFLLSDVFSGRFIPGTLTNPDLTGKNTHLEPKILLVINPAFDLQAIKEANMVGIPVIALADTDNTINGLDFIIPCNNKSKDSVYLILWLIALEYFRIYGT